MAIVEVNYKELFLRGFSMVYLFIRYYVNAYNAVLNIFKQSNR